MQAARGGQGADQGWSDGEQRAAHATPTFGLKARVMFRTVQWLCAMHLVGEYHAVPTTRARDPLSLGLMVGSTSNEWDGMAGHGHGHDEKRRMGSVLSHKGESENVSEFTWKTGMPKP